MISMIAILLAIACVVGMGFSSNVIKSKASIIKAIYHYEIIGGGLNFRYIEGEAQNVIKPLEKISVVDTYDQSITAREIGKNIMSTVTFQLKAATPILVDLIWDNIE